MNKKQWIILISVAILTAFFEVLPKASPRTAVMFEELTFEPSMLIFLIGGILFFALRSRK